MARWHYAAILLAALAVTAGGWAAWAFWASPGRSRELPVWGYKVANTFPHQQGAFTQGLAWHDRLLYESTGGYGTSALREVNPETGQELRRIPLDRRVFGEGLCVWGDRIYQITWRQGTGLVFDRQTLRVLQQFHYAGEGWGLTHDGTHLIMSNGSSTLQFLDPRTYRVVKRLPVRANGRPLRKLNELEYVGQEIWSNVWHTDRIARISPSTGDVVGWVDLTGLMPRSELRHKEQVLNGIAYDPENKRLFVTGKQWPKLFEIQLVPPRSQP
jgi:glutamine cyclotransferase